MAQFTSDSNHASPRRASLMNSFEFSSGQAIHHILSGRAFSEICSAIVQRVMVLVVTIFFGSTSSNQPMHENHSTASERASDIKLFGEFVKMRLPIPLRKPFKILGIYNRILVLGEGNKFITTVRRLYDGMTWFECWHCAVLL
jgi:hypothetical protein